MRLRLRFRLVPLYAMVLLMLTFSGTLALAVGSDTGAQPTPASPTGIPHPGWLGLYIEYHPETGPDGHPRNYGFLVVHRVFPGGPGDKAGIRVNDLVTKIDGQPVHLPDPKSLVTFFSKIKIGQAVQLRVVREGRAFETTLTAGAMPPDHLRAWETLWRAVHQTPSP